MRKCKFKQATWHYVMSSGERPNPPWEEALFHSFTQEGDAIVELSNKTIKVLPLKHANTFYEFQFIE